MTFRVRDTILGCALCFVFGACNDGRDLQTVVAIDDGRVVVRYADGKVRKVLNDMDYDLAPGQEVKVVENCDGKLHVAAAYAQ